MQTNSPGTGAGQGSNTRHLTREGLNKVVAFVAILVVITFAASGRLDWAMGWFYLGIAVGAPLSF